LKIHRAGLFSMFVMGPSPKIDWFEGERTNNEQIACISMNDADIAVLHVYDCYRHILNIQHRCRIDFEIINPKFPDNLVEHLSKIIDHHALLCECENDEYRGFVMEQRMAGKIVTMIEDVPENRLC
jgi:hypothetical protein